MVMILDTGIKRSHSILTDDMIARMLSADYQTPTMLWNKARKHFPKIAKSTVRHRLLRFASQRTQTVETKADGNLAWRLAVPKRAAFLSAKPYGGFEPRRAVATPTWTKRKGIALTAFLASGEPVGHYASIDVAAEALQLREDVLYKCLTGEHASAKSNATGKEYQFLYGTITEPQRPVVRYRGRQTYRIDQLRRNGTLVASFTTASEAARQTGIEGHNIRAAYRAMTATAGGFRWRKVAI